MKNYVSTTNTCTLCAPLGACLAFRGIEGAVPFLHGSQGCATYMRRYIISHFREPMDIASSSLGEKQAIYGGGANLKLGLKNVLEKYGARLIGVATTCLTETIGDDVPALVREFCREAGGGTGDVPLVVPVSTPSYAGTHREGFLAAVRAVVEQVAEAGPATESVNLLPGFVSPADLRYLKEILADFGLPGVVFPDYADSLDGPAKAVYDRIPPGGTSLNDLREMGRARATVELGRVLALQTGAGKVLHGRFGVPLRSLGLPVGLRETDRFFEALAEVSGRPVPEKHQAERGRLVDAYVDAHKYVFGKRAVVYGEEDLVVGLTAFLAEMGVRPVLCVTGGSSGRLAEAIAQVTRGLLPEPPRVREGTDFYELAEEARELMPEILIGHSKGYHLARRWGVPLLRVGFPIHDRFGAARLLHLGYRGALSLLDRLVNLLLARKQEDSPVGYGYL